MISRYSPRKYASLGNPNLIERASELVVHPSEYINYARVLPNQNGKVSEDKILSAMRVFEGYTGNSLSRTITDIYWDNSLHAKKFELNVAPLVKVLGFYAYDEGNTEVLIDPTQYFTMTYDLGAYLVLNENFCWPFGLRSTASVRARILTGFVFPATVANDNITINCPLNPYVDNDKVTVSVTGQNGGTMPTAFLRNQYYYVINSAPGTLQLSDTQGGVAKQLTGLVGQLFVGTLPEDIKKGLLLAATVDQFFEASRDLSDIKDGPDSKIVFDYWRSYCRRRFS